MKRDWAVLAAMAMLVLCVVAYTALSRSFARRALSDDAGGGPVPVSKTEATANTGALAASAASVPAKESLNVEPALRRLLGLDVPPRREEGDLVTEPERCYFRERPWGLAYFEKDNLLLMVNRDGVFAFDVVTGTEVWHRAFGTSKTRHGAVLRQDWVVGVSEGIAFLLDARTGREIWTARNDQSGPAFWATVSPDESQILVAYERTCILYARDGRELRVLSRSADAEFRGWLPGNRELMFVQWEGKDEATVRKYQTVDVESGTVTPVWERRGKPNVTALSALGKFAEAVPGGVNDTTLRIFDARTDRTIREFKGIPGTTKRFAWLKNGSQLFSVTTDGKQTRIIDGETGEIEFTLEQEGHQFRWDSSEDASDKAWIFSQDDSRDYWVWPLIPDAVPRKVMDGSDIFPGGGQLFVSDRCYLESTDWAENQVRARSVYALDGLNKIAAWRIGAKAPSRYCETMASRAATHLVRWYSDGKDDAYRARSMAFDVYARDTETPVYTGRGRFITISPDGRYVVAQDEDTTASLHDVEAHQIVGQFSAPAEGEDYSYYMTAAFSDDGKRLAVNTSKTIEVMDLAGGYIQWPMDVANAERFRGGRLCMPPDGARVLCGGYGNVAWLFDADTGRLMHTFEETERFARPWQQAPGLWNGIATFANDVAGMVSSRFRWGTNIEIAFADGGARVITHAVGQIIRVWDASSGQLLHAIHTGLPEKRNKDGYIGNQIVLSATGRFAFCYNQNNFGTASLWSLADGTRQRRYQLPGGEESWVQGVPEDDGSAVYIQCRDKLCRWPGAPARE